MSKNVLFFLTGWMIIAVTNSCHQKTINDSLPFYNDESFTPQWINAKDEKSIHTIPDFNFIDQQGNKVTGKTFENKITVVDFFFTTCPGICKRLTSAMAKVQEEFKDERAILLLSHSVTPRKDSVPVLAAYAKLNGAIPGKWFMITGDKNAIYKLARTAYFADEDMGWKQDSTTFLHTENILLIDKQHHIRGVYKGTVPGEINNLVSDIKTLEKE